jgi:hypothetical protein
VLLYLDFNAQTNFDAHFFDFEENKFKLVGSFPFKEPVLLKGIFVENENLLVKLSAVN